MVVGLVVVLVYLFAETHGKSCHYNVHLVKRLNCTEPAR
jgi:hypothetical protein